MTGKRVGAEQLARCRACRRPIGFGPRPGGISCSDSCRQQKPARQFEHRDSIICELYARDIDPNVIAAHYKMSRQAIMRIIDAF